MNIIVWFFIELFIVIMLFAATVGMVCGAAILLKCFWCDWKELDKRRRDCE